MLCPFRAVDQLLLPSEEFVQQHIMEIVFYTLIAYLSIAMLVAAWLGWYRIEVVKEDTSRRAVKKAELPGLWFSSDEAFALLTAEQLLTTIEPGILGPKLKPLMDKLNRLLESSGHAADAVNSRIKISPSGKRKLRIEPFQVVARATLERKRLPTMSSAHIKSKISASAVSPSPQAKTTGNE